jgi:hypothetical protein
MQVFLRKLPMKRLQMTDYAAVIEEYKARYCVRVSRWREERSGCAWVGYYADGTAVAWIESPYPRDIETLAIFLHEIGHHAVGFGDPRVRGEEEFRAWRWAMVQLGALGITPDQRVKNRFERSRRIRAVEQANRKSAHLVRTVGLRNRIAPSVRTAAA